MKLTVKFALAGAILGLFLLPGSAQARVGVFIGFPGFFPFYYPPPAYYYPPPPPPMAYYPYPYYPRPAYRPAPAVAPAGPQRTFRVFFDFNRATLTPEGARIVQEAAAAYRQTGSARIDVTGYTDLAGTGGYNMGLSRQRADTVKAALVAAGVPAAAVAESWRGKTNPLKPTPDGMREPQNRRVEIVISPAPRRS